MPSFNHSTQMLPAQASNSPTSPCQSHASQREPNARLLSDNPSPLLRQRAKSQAEVQQLVRKLAKLAQLNILAKKYPKNTFMVLNDVIESLAIPSGQYQVLQARIQNAQRYAQSGEFGAAAFELRMVK